jgi:hypothetical protein
MGKNKETKLKEKDISKPALTPHSGKGSPKHVNGPEEKGEERKNAKA